MKGPANIGVLVLGVSSLATVLMLTYVSRHDLMETTARRGYPIWLCLAVPGVGCVYLIVRAVWGLRGR